MSWSPTENIRVTIFGQSHSAAVGMTLEGVPAGERIDMEALSAFLARRAPGRNEWSTRRREEDRPEFLSGLTGDTTCGAPITAVLRNADARPEDYAATRDTPRPGHADYTAAVKYFGAQDSAGGGPFSGRLTAPLCVAGGICAQLLEREGIRIMARVASIADVEDEGGLTESLAAKEFPTVSDERGARMRERIAAAKAEGDSLGGVVECRVAGLPAGLGGPLFEGMEGRVALVVFGIPAVKGVEFGAGFAAAAMRGSENNDAFCIEDGEVRTRTNHAGGILGGVTSGMPITFRAAFKPTPSVGRPQRTVDLAAMREVETRFAGRHDPCVVPRAVPCVEAAAAIAVYDALLGRRRERR